MSLRDCLTSTLRHGLAHTAVRAALLSATLLGPMAVVAALNPSTAPALKVLGFLFGCVLTLVVSSPLWAVNTSLHILIAEGNARNRTLIRGLRRDAASSPMKAAALVFCRLPLLVILALQLHLLALSVLWIAENLGGFDTALLGAELSFLSNPLYTIALFLLSWLLLTPFFEAGNFLLHTDIRTRQEGLDLQHRVRRVFAGINRQDAKDAKKKTERRTKLESNLSILCLSLGVLAVCSLRGGAAEKGQQETVRSVRQGVETIRAEVQKAEPYPGGQRWVGRLRKLGKELADSGDGEARRVRWFEQIITDFGDRKKEDALIVLDDLHRRLSLLEDSLTAEGGANRRSPEDVKSLLRGSEARPHERTRPREQIKKERKEAQREEVRRDDPEPEGRRVHGGGGEGVSAPAVSLGGFSVVGWWFLWGVALAILAAALYLFLSSRRGSRPPKRATVTGQETVPAESEARQVLEESPSELWRQAETLAGAGRFREAVRGLYLAVLALLHRQQLIRFEPTRTNGEYVRQVRLSERAPPELHEPFHQLTNLFEAKWYGERACASADYRACRTLAEEIQNTNPQRQQG